MAKIFGKRFTLGQDPELFESKKGKQIVSFSAAENHWKYDKKDDEFTKLGTTWFDFVAFGDTAIDVFTELQKGDSFSVDIRYNKKYDRYETDAQIRDDVWETDKGEKRSRKKVYLYGFKKIEDTQKDE